MEITELKEWSFFTIGKTPSYPKLRTPSGYFDVRDNIHIETDKVSFDIFVMSNIEVANSLCAPVTYIEEMARRFQKNYELSVEK